MNLIDCLNWRYAAKSMNGLPIPVEKLTRILEAIRLTPTSSGLQPFEVLVISNPALKAQICPIAMDQRQVVECSHLLVIAGWDRFTPERIDYMFDLTNTQRGGKNAGLEAYRAYLHKHFAAMDEAAHIVQAAKQAYLALSSALIAAAAEQVDSTPMEGFENEALDALLGLKARGLRSAVMLALGYRNPTHDWNVGLKKIRRSAEEIFEFID